MVILLRSWARNSRGKSAPSKKPRFFWLTNPVQYWRRVAKKWDVYRYITFHAEVIEARWSESDALWYVKIRNTKTGEVRLTLFPATVITILMSPRCLPTAATC